MRALFDHWRALWLANGHKVPARDKLDPAAIRAHLPHIQIFHVEPTGRFRWGLTGRAVVAGFGCDPTGSYLDELIPPAVMLGAAARFTQVLARGRPLFYATNLKIPDRELKWFRRLVVPMHDRAGAATVLVSAVSIFYPHHKEMMPFSIEFDPEEDIPQQPPGAAMPAGPDSCSLSHTRRG